MPRLKFLNLQNRVDWGAPKYPRDGEWTPFNPDLWVLHWAGGGGTYETYTATKAAASAALRGIRNYHINVRGWRDAAYNYAAADDEKGKAYRIRGENQNGANKDSGYWGSRTRTFVFLSGPHSPRMPSKTARLSFARLWVEDPHPVTGHGLLPPSPSGVEQQTACPGPWLTNTYIPNRGWITDLGILQRGDRSMEVQSLKRRLQRLGYRRMVGGRGFNSRLDKQVRRFQMIYGITIDGLVGPETWKTLASA